VNEKLKLPDAQTFEAKPPGGARPQTIKRNPIAGFVLMQMSDRGLVCHQASTS
jgi:hypothetical protein